MTGLSVLGSLELTGIDGSALPAGGRTVSLDNAPPFPERAKVRMTGVIGPVEGAASKTDRDGTP